jgi:hypothetical protein
MKTWQLSKKKIQVLALMRDESLSDVARNAGYGASAGYIYRALNSGDVMLSTASRIARALEVEDLCDILEDVEVAEDHNFAVAGGERNVAVKQLKGERAPSKRAKGG